MSSLMYIVICFSVLLRVPVHKQYLGLYLSYYPRAGAGVLERIVASRGLPQEQGGGGCACYALVKSLDLRLEVKDVGPNFDLSLNSHEIGVKFQEV